MGSVERRVEGTRGESCQRSTTLEPFDVPNAATSKLQHMHTRGETNPLNRYRNKPYMVLNPREYASLMYSRGYVYFKPKCQLAGYKTWRWPLC
ncbi:Hypothetical predicted protein [Prunus dulcis]|uniref:Uncharacterized protein n=1 Tax=Prunus dulcis TaxID=3755 RepID=A0A5E4ERL5_PRUDU|nr:Hypothetical predicted protein [Prunus dulcis]